jgi:hypothetical protein
MLESETSPRTRWLSETFMSTNPRQNDRSTPVPARMTRHAFLRVQERKKPMNRDVSSHRIDEGSCEGYVGRFAIERRIPIWVTGTLYCVYIVQYTQ